MKDTILSVVSGAIGVLMYAMLMAFAGPGPAEVSADLAYARAAQAQACSGWYEAERRLGLTRLDLAEHQAETARLRQELADAQAARSQLFWDTLYRERELRAELTDTRGQLLSAQARLVWVREAAFERELEARGPAWGFFYGLGCGLANAPEVPTLADMAKARYPGDDPRPY